MNFDPGQQVLVVRCDGTSVTGLGHVSRCLPVAKAAMATGMQVLFIGDYSLIAQTKIQEAGLAHSPVSVEDSLGIPASASAALIDLYGEAQGDLRETCAQRPSFVFHDLGESVPADAVAIDYHGDAQGEGLTGPAFAPLSPELLPLRAGDNGENPDILVTLGASGAGRDALPRVLEHLGAQGLLHRTTVVVADPGEVLEGTAPKAIVAGSASLIPLLARCSVVVCGAGVTAYEAICANRYVVPIVLAENQQRVEATLLTAEPGLDCFHWPGELDGLADAVTAGLRASGKRACSAVFDCMGSIRIRNAVISALAGWSIPRVVTYRPATARDADLLRGWRNDPIVRAAAVHTAKVTAAEHAAWLQSVLADPDRTLVVALLDGNPVGVIRFDRSGRESTISISIDSSTRAGGLGTQIIRETSELELAARETIDRVWADIRLENIASLKAFERAGYRETGESHHPGLARFLFDRSSIRVVPGPATIGSSFRAP